MAEAGGAKKSQKGRKIGRSKRKPSHMRYNLENRREKNKLRKINKNKKMAAKKAAKKGK